MWPDCDVKTVLSLAPPAEEPKQKLNAIETQWKKSLTMLGYITMQILNGDAVFKTVEDQYPNILFMRTRPTSKETSIFPMDEMNIDAMEEAMEQELCNPKYLKKIVISAAIIASRMIKKLPSADAVYSGEQPKNQLRKEHIQMLLELAHIACNNNQLREYITGEILRSLLSKIRNGMYLYSISDKSQLQSFTIVIFVSDRNTT